MSPGALRVLPEGDLLDDQGKDRLLLFRRVVERQVAHIHVAERVRPVGLREAAIAARGRGQIDERLFADDVPAADDVGERGAAEVSRHQLRRHLGERSQHDADGPLADLPVGVGGSVERHVDDRPGIRHAAERPERACVDAPHRIERRLHGDHDAGERHGRRRVDDARQLRGRPPEVRHQLVAGDLELERDEAGVQPTAAEELDVVLGVVDPVGKRRDAGAHAPLGAVEVRVHHRQEPLFAVPLDHLQDALLADAAGADAGEKIAAPLFGEPDVGHQQGPGRLVQLAALVDLQRRDADPLVEDVGRLARVGAGADPAHVRPVGADGREAEELTVEEHGQEHGHVVQVRAAPVGVVQENDVPGREIFPQVLHARAHAPREGHDVAGVIRPLRDDLASGIEQAAREVLDEGDDGGVGRLHHVGPHLGHGRGQPFDHDLLRDRIQVHV